MEDVYTYYIEIRGQIEEADFNQTSPLKLTVERKEEKRSLLCTQTDQSGLVGLIRHLHGMGFVFLSIQACEREKAAAALPASSNSKPVE